MCSCTRSLRSSCNVLQDKVENASTVDISDSDLNSDGNGSDHESGDNDIDSDHDSVENWDGIAEDDFARDIPAATPLPEPEKKKSRLQQVSAMVFWLVYFLLIWQATCKLSDNGLVWLLQFLFKFFRVLGVTISNEFLADLISVLPSSLYLLRQFINFDRDYFTKYVVCPKCTKLYSYDSCLKVQNNRTVAKQCSNSFMVRGKKKICNAQLVKRVQLKEGKEQFYPISYYCYNSIIEELERILQRKGIPESCEKWRNLSQCDETLSDVYCGQIWKDFLSYKGEQFLSVDRNYGLMLNFDFFQPMKHRKDYSVGVLYLVILNLPRHLRFKWENVIVIGIVPSMNGEPKSLNEFLRPAVDELKAMWKGVRLKSSLSSITLKFRAALLCVSADVPAARKLCGFKGHSAHQGCSRCMKKFSGGFGEKKDYSGFDRENWPPRTNREHRSNAKKLEKCQTITGRNKLSQETGINYWSCLLDLEYFDVVRFCTVDPMHNLFLGTAKYMFKLWEKEEIIGKKGMKLLEQRIQEMDVPTDIGRLPKKIASNYGSYTAEQWKNWTLIYSMYALKGVIGETHLQCWQTFVLACKYLCRKTISHIDLQRADLLLLKFCKEVEKLYGKKAVTPNMHLHCHLKEIITDHGPIHSFWCFSFERYNGIMGSVFTNKRSLELQLMRKLTLSRFLDSIQLPLEFRDDFKDLLSNPFSSDEMSVNSLVSSATSELQGMSTVIPVSSGNWSAISHVSFPSNYKLQSLESDDLDWLFAVYSSLYADQSIDRKAMATTIKKYSSVTIGSQLYGSKMECRSLRSARIYASWAANTGGLNLNELLFFAGSVLFYFSHSIKLNGNFVQHVFARVLWYKPDNNPDLYGNPTKMWKLNDLLPYGPSNLIPVQRIYCRYAAAETVVEGEKKLITVPLDNKQYQGSFVL